MISAYRLDTSPRADSWRISCAGEVLKDTELPVLPAAVEFILKRHSLEEECRYSRVVSIYLLKKLSQGAIETSVEEILAFARETKFQPTSKTQR